jgi:hypothetical protein
MVCYTNVVYKRITYPIEGSAQDEYNYMISSGDLFVIIRLMHGEIYKHR